MRLQFRQNGRLTDAMKPTRPMPSAKRYSVAGARAVAIRDFFERPDFALQHRDHIVGQQHAVALPQALRVERHELDIADFDAALAAVPGQRNDIGLHQILHRDGVDLDRADTQAPADLDAVEHFVADRRGA